jgi:hypothetical protein
MNLYQEMSVNLSTQVKIAATMKIFIFFLLGMVYWVNNDTRESSWKHPYHDKYRRMLTAARAQRPLQHWKSIMAFQVEFMFSQILSVEGDEDDEGHQLSPVAGG